MALRSRKNDFSRTAGVCRARRLCVLLTYSLASISSAQQILQPGSILPKVATLQNAEQTYALYLPSNYAPGKRWPIIYAFDPAARGRVPVELMKDSAEKYGYIVAGSNNSRNGSGKIQSEAVRAIFQDTGARLSIDERRIYFAGFSGGARRSAELAQHCACAAGVILSGAGFQPASQKAHNSFAVFAAIGSFDFNYGEMIGLDKALRKSGSPHFLRRFEGPHQWPPAGVLEEALAWLRLQAMKTNREPRDDSFIAAQGHAAFERASAFESADLFAAWFEYAQAAETLEGLSEVSRFASRQKALETQKAVVDAAKREKQEINEQEELSSDIFKSLASLSNRTSDDASPRINVRDEVREKILALKNRADREKRPDKARVMKRSLGGILVGAMETGMARSAAGDTAEARAYFELAVVADPDAVWALTSLAVARATEGDKKGALEALRQAKAKWNDQQAFMDWLNSQAGFSKFRDTPEFRTLLE